MMVAVVSVNVTMGRLVMRRTCACLKKPVPIPATLWALYVGRFAVSIVVLVVRAKCANRGPVLMIRPVCPLVTMVVISPTVVVTRVSVAMGRFVTVIINV
jgi:hypothetical protein